MADLIANHFTYSDEQLAVLRAVAEKLMQSDKTTDMQTAAPLADWLARHEARAELLDGYINAFLTKDGEPRKRLFTSGALKDESLIEALLAEQQRVLQFEEIRKTAAVLAHSTDVLNLAEGLLAEYEEIKRAHAWMDYDDLILAASELLTRDGMSEWVLFKLDGGIDHILVDEAQDTSPEQWQIVDALTREFFAGVGRGEQARSIFVVGDEKQSIYSFQGADVKELAKMQAYFSSHIKAAQKPVHHIALTKSYRSTDAVLQAVDAVFANPKARAGVTFGDADITHIPTRSGQPGLVEIWPLIRGEEEESAVSPSTLLARKIAEEIAGWIARGQARAGDIMILLRSRGTMADRLVRALKRRGVPVAGSDRMRLNDSLAVQDLIALGQVLLLPEDDFTLACALKSPIFNLSEDELFTLAYGRCGISLWQRLSEMPEFAAAYELLTELRARVDFIPPFELYSYLLDTLGARARMVGRMGQEVADPIDEFLQQTLLYEMVHPPSMQGFLHWLEHSNSEIKRDMEQTRDAVRIMTVHGSKGLQSKIVMLPDTVEPPRIQESILWLDDIPLRVPEAGKANKICKELYASEREEMLAEYRRLLYVAMTRAEDRLYICGATTKDKISEESWYALVEAGLSSLGVMPDAAFAQERSDWQGKAGDVASNGQKVLDASLRWNDDFSFLTTPPPAEPTPTRPLTPSRPVFEEPATSPPLPANQLYATGKYVHLLLQYLPLHEAASRAGLAQIIARKFAGQIPQEEIENAASNAISIIENPEFSFLFSEKSLAEVPITGTIEIVGEPITVSGQIDRLCIGDEVWIVDFKSNQRPPKSLAAVPKAYTRQLALYRALMQKIEPGKKVNCALLWTSSAKLDILPEAMLDEAILKTG